MGEDYRLWCKDKGKCGNFGEDAVLWVKITFYVHDGLFLSRNIILTYLLFPELLLYLDLLVVEKNCFDFEEVSLAHVLAGDEVQLL